jgi:diadenosine tetraphosphate (Ap4A) HIT family hydrolase
MTVVKKLMSEAGWSLHPQLEKDTSPVGDLALSRLLAINDADYPWLVLVPRRVKRDGKDHALSDITEIADLAVADAALLMDEIARVSRVLKSVTGCDKLNIGAIGNIVPQLHIHIVARRKDDPLWPKPVWGHVTPRAGDAAAFERFVEAIQKDVDVFPQGKGR